jgi:hypothetical protein
MIKNLLALTLCAGAILSTGCGDKDSGGDEGSDGGGSSASDLCADYIAALTECYTEAGLDVSALGFNDTYCDAYTDTTYVAFFECYNDAISAADCSTQEGITALSTAASSCVPG